jgi:hypothetical protein
MSSRINRDLWEEYFKDLDSRQEAMQLIYDFVKQNKLDSEQMSEFGIKAWKHWGGQFAAR